jgi:L-threonylcarbamoyladenylate synthase
VKIVPPTPEGLREAVRALRAGEVLAYPTETVYGLAVDPYSESALRKLFAVKGRPENNPVLLIVADEQQLYPLVREISPQAAGYIRAFWPGPLSLLFPRAEGISDVLSAGGAKVCARCPASSIARGLCREFGGAITSSSANRSGETPAHSLREITLEGVALGIDGGVLAPSPPSTVFDPDERRILREGCVSAETLLGFSPF